MNEQQFEAGLRDAYVARVSYPDVDAITQSVLTTRIEQTPQQRGFLPPTTIGRFQSMFSATKYVVAGAIVALFGGFLLSGVLIQPSDIRLPAVGASASATRQAEPTEAATSESAPTEAIESDIVTTTPDLLPGVDLVTEEVEPGVYRVLSDGVRELAAEADQAPAHDLFWSYHNIAAGLDGSVWRFGPHGLFRLGHEETHRWDRPFSGIDQLAFDDFEVAPDGTIWRAALVRGQLSSFDGKSWTPRRKNIAGVEVKEDGTVWATWANDRPRIKVGRLTEDGWETRPGGLEGGVGLCCPGNQPFAVSAGPDDDVWFAESGLYRHDGGGWVQRATLDAQVARIDSGPDGTVWIRLGDSFQASATLARSDGEGWQIFQRSDGIPESGDHYQGFAGVFEVAPDGNLWFNPSGDPVEHGRDCAGIARFDGDALARFLGDRCVYAMDIARDGDVWLLAGDWADLNKPGPIHTFVITPEAVAATD